MAKSRRYTDEDIIEYCRESLSYRQVLTKLGLDETGGNYKSLKDNIKRLDIDISHFTHATWNKGKIIGPQRPIEDYLNNVVSISSHKLRLRLINEGMKEAKCERCNLMDWNDEPIPLELDHINGDHDDNRLENLRILCPNCHYQTPTHRGKNRKAGRIMDKEKTELGDSRVDKKTLEKHYPFHSDLPRLVWEMSLEKIAEKYKCSPDTINKLCKELNIEKPDRYYWNKNRDEYKTKINWPSNEELSELVWRVPTSELSKKLGVSDSAIGKHCKKNNIKKPPRGHWMKQ